MNVSLSEITRSAALAALTVAAGAAGVAAAQATDLPPAPVLACEECPAGEYRPIWPDAAPWIVFDPAPGTPEED